MTRIEIEKGTVITLSEYEQEIAKMCAEKRSKNNRRHNVKNNNFTAYSDFEVDLQGFGGEMAFCKLFKLYPDMEIGVRSAKEDKGDCTLDGFRIDVKTSRNDNGNLFVGINKQPTVYAYALMTGLFPQFTFRGFILTSDMMSTNRVTKMPGGICFKAEQNELLTWDAVHFLDLGFEAVNPFTRRKLASV
jgi:hypothetical protein